MVNCPNCGAPLEPYKCKCEFCGTWYFDLTAFDMSDGNPYYVKFRTPYGVLTTLAKPEVQTIDVWDDSVDITSSFGTHISSFTRNRNCDIGVVFHAINDPETNTLYQLDTSK